MTLVSLVEFLVGYAFLLIAASVHESSHAWTAFKFGDPTAKLQNRVSLNPANHIDILGTVIIPFMAFISNFPLIGWARPTPVNPANFQNPRKAEMFVSGAGPVSNLLTAIFLGFLWHLANSMIATIGVFAQLFCYVFSVGIYINFILAIFNLLPIHPLDGSGVLRSLLPPSWALHYDRLRPYGFIGLLILFYLPAFRQIFWGIVNLFLQAGGIRLVPLPEIW